MDIQLKKNSELDSIVLDRAGIDLYAKRWCVGIPQVSDKKEIDDSINAVLNTVKRQY